MEDRRMELVDIVRRIVGPVRPIGEANSDEERFENLKQLTELVDYLIGDIDHVAGNKHRAEYSMKRAGEFADRFLTNLGIEE